MLVKVLHQERHLGGGLLDERLFGDELLDNKCPGMSWGED